MEYQPHIRRFGHRGLHPRLGINRFLGPARVAFGERQKCLGGCWQSRCDKSNDQRKREGVQNIEQHVGGHGARAGCVEPRERRGCGSRGWINRAQVTLSIPP